MKKIKSRNLRRRNLRWIKLAFVLVFVFCGFKCTNYVDAGMNDSVIEKNRVDGIYAVANVDGVNRIFYLNMYELNGRISYCIELGVDITTSIYHSTSDFSISSLTEKQIEYIRSISYFGYGYEGHSNYRYYMAAQELIWDYLGNGTIDVEWTDVLDVNGIRIDIDSYKNEILKLRDWYSKKLVFNYDEDLSYKVGDEIVLTDSSGTLNDYQVVSSIYSDAYIDGNNLVIKVGNQTGLEKISLSRNSYYDYYGSLYYYDNSQRLISNGNYKNNLEEVSFLIEGFSFKGQVIDKKTGEGKPLGQASFQGAKYELYDKDRNLVGIYETDENGVFEVKDLLAGTYYIKQLEASAGYLVNEVELVVEVNADNLEVNLEQEVISNDIEIRKYFGDGSKGSYFPEDDIEFEIYDNNGNVYDYFMTDSEGFASIWLPYGQYVVHQINSTMGYAKVDDFKIEVKEKLEEKVSFNLFNEFVMIRIKVFALEEESKKVLFLDGFSYMIKEKSSGTYLDYEGQQIFKMNDSGELVVPVLLPYGEYILETVSVPEGILLNGVGLEFSIDERTNLLVDESGLIEKVRVYYEFIKGKINIIANEEKFYVEDGRYSYEKEPKVDAEISLVAKEDIVVNGKVLYQSGSEIYKGMTNDDGQIVIDNLYLGNYCLVQNVNEEEYCLTFTSENNKVGVVEKTIEITNKLNKGNIVIHNISSKGDNIENSLFEVLNNEKEVVYTGITNSDGIIKINNILNGSYCIKQRKVASGYQLETDEFCFVLDEEKNINFVNNIEIKQKVEVPDTLSDSIGIYEILLVLGMIGTGILVYKKIFVSKLYR